jgi:feruloyl esterase
MPTLKSSPRWVFLLVFFIVRPLMAQQSCESLTSLKLPQTTITSAATVSAGPLKLQTVTGELAFDVPARCEVRGVIRPSSDSEIQFAVWMPPTWNGKYRQEGNGGFAGGIPYPNMVDPLRRGYATAGTDDGHDLSTQGAVWAIGHPERVVDYGYRAVHETSVQSKAIVRAFYGREASLSYFSGCSDGGREGLLEAQRFPEDFNGILAGAPANNFSHLLAGFLWNEQALFKSPASTIPAAKLPLIQNAALAMCDAADGVKDGLIRDPRTCRFDPAPLVCKGRDSNECLTAPQAEALRKIYAGPKNPRTGDVIFPGYPPGTEAFSWASWIVGGPQPALQTGFGNSYYGEMIFEKPKWDFRTMNFDRDVTFADQKAGWIIDSTSPDLRSFRAHGGKLIQYHGWADAAISPINSVNYYEQVRDFTTKYPDPRSDASKPVDDFYRLFMAPGLAHCSGGAGPINFGNSAFNSSVVAAGPDRDAFAALEQWVEKGVAPDRITGSGPAPLDPSKTMSRPLCPHPQVAVYKGSGDSNDATNFTCAVPR